MRKRKIKVIGQEPPKPAEAETKSTKITGISNGTDIKVTAEGDVVVNTNHPEVRVTHSGRTHTLLSFADALLSMIAAEPDEESRPQPAPAWQNIVDESVTVEWILEISKLSDYAFVRLGDEHVLVDDIKRYLYTRGWLLDPPRYDDEDLDEEDF